VQTVAQVAGAAATLTAVVLGYFLSRLTERRAWTRRKTEQVRDRQLDTLVLLLTVLNELLARRDATSHITGRMMAAVQSSTLGRQARDAILANSHVELEEEIARWIAALRDVDRLKVTLDLLGFQDKGLKAVSDSHHAVEEILGALQDTLDHPDELPRNTDVLWVALNSALSRVVLNARSGLVE